MTIFIAIQHTYDGIEFALFRGDTMLAHHALSKFQASSLLIPHLDQSLKEHNLSLKDLAFFAANYGPGPFTTLRTVIATLNGIAFARNVPLVGVDGLKAFVAEYQNSPYERTICILNAFNHDVYYAYHDEHNALITGYAPGELFLRDIALQLAPIKSIQFVGNATEMYRPLIQELFESRAFIPSEIPATCSIKQIGLMGYEYWQRHEQVTHQLMPHYLKMQQFTKCS